MLVARGNAAAKLQAEAQPGRVVTLRLILQPDWSVVSDAIGGGPVLVRDGAPVYRSNEGFTTSQLAPRGPRTAVGQRADGGIVLLTTDGRQPGFSVGMTNFELAQALVRFGAVRGMGLDGGGSSTLAFEGTVLNSPSDGRERAVSTALMLQYYGVYAPPPLEAVVSPNGDGVAEDAEALVQGRPPVDRDGDAHRAGRVDRVAGGGRARSGDVRRRVPSAAAVSAASAEGVASAAVRPTPLPPAEGRWTLTVSATDDQGLELDDDAALRRQLDARLAPRRARACRRPPDRRHERTSAGRRHAQRA